VWSSTICHLNFPEYVSWEFEARLSSAEQVSYYWNLTVSENENDSCCLCRRCWRVEEDVSYTRTERGDYPPCVVTEWNPSGDPPILLSLLAAKTELCEAKSVRQGCNLGAVCRPQMEHSPLGSWSATGGIMPNTRYRQMNRITDDLHHARLLVAIWPVAFSMLYWICWPEMSHFPCYPVNKRATVNAMLMLCA
jgi:hypothetical protein